MGIFVNILLLAVGWFAGTFAFGWLLSSYQAYKDTKNTSSLITAILILVIAGGSIALAFSISTMSGIFLLIGELIAFFMVIDPFDMTAEKAHDIGARAAREAALKEQMEEQQKREKQEMAENARIYREAKKANEKKDR